MMKVVRFSGCNYIKEVLLWPVFVVGFVVLENVVQCLVGVVVVPGEFVSVIGCSLGVAFEM